MPPSIRYSKNMKINSASLAEASTLASQIEALQGQLDELNSQVASATKQLVPLQSRFQSILGSMSSKGVKVSKCSRKGGKFTPEQRAAISAGLKAKWAERKAVKTTQPAADPVPIAS